MFRNAHHILITGGQLTNIESNNDAVSTTLLNHVAAGAMFDSAERYPPGRCHPCTRTRMIARITDWIKDDNAAQHILWLFGPAGAGKSAIMQSICEFLRKSYPEKYGGSFFFARGSTDRGGSTKLFLTLSYQLAVQFPAVRAEINDALSRDPSLPTKSIDTQLRSLIIDPLLRCQQFLTQTPAVIIDGLDECGNDGQLGIQIQRDLITLISDSNIEHDDIPIRFIVASRPEYWIRDTFEATPVSDITLSLSLRDDTDADADILRYLTDGFEKIRLENSRVMRSVELPWPPRRTIGCLMEEASGQFIYASTVLKFVGKGPRFSDPRERLRIIMTPGPHQASAFTELDKLYATILSVYPHRKTMKRVLGGLLAKLDLSVIGVVFNVDPTEIAYIVDALSSLIDIVSPNPLSEQERLLTPIFGSSLSGDDEILFCHLSFSQFLQDKTRSGRYYVDVSAVRLKYISSFFHKIHRNIDQNYKIEPHVSFNNDLNLYRRTMYQMSRCVAESIMVKFSNIHHDILLRMLKDTTAKLRWLDPDAVSSMNHPACFIQDMHWIVDMATGMENGCTFEISANRMLGRASPMFQWEIYPAVRPLRQFASKLLWFGIHLLSSHNRLGINRALMLIHVLRQSDDGVRLETLLSIPDSSASAMLPTLRQHRHIIQLNCLKNESRPLSEKINDKRPEGIFLSLNSWVIEGLWLDLEEWRNQKVLFVCECLKGVINAVDDDEKPMVRDGSNTRIIDVKPTIVREFLDDRTSNINNGDYFDNQSNLSLLSVIMDDTAWTSLFASRPGLWKDLYSVISPVFCWLNEQLTESKSLRLMQDHDASLPQKMTTTMNTMFLHCLVPIFTTPYFSELIISTSSEGKEGKSIRLTALPDSSCLEQETIYVPPEDHPWETIDHIQRTVFGLRHGSWPVGHSIIERSLWFPHVASYILNLLVKNLYLYHNPDFMGNGHHELIHEEFAYIVHCIPYAQTTQQNLDALRVVKFLSNYVEMSAIPFGFCVRIFEFLKKYEPSVLSSDELHAFERWLFDFYESGPIASPLSPIANIRPRPLRPMPSSEEH